MNETGETVNIYYPLHVMSEGGVARYEATVAYSRAEWEERNVAHALGSLGLRGVLDVLALKHTPAEIIAALGMPGPEPEPDIERWRLPVGEGEYPAQMWYVASIHDLTGTKRQPFGSPRRHLGLDVNLDRYERGNVEIRLGLSAYAMAAGEIVHSSRNWMRTGVNVIRHMWRGVDYYVRYAHVATGALSVGSHVVRGQRLGGFDPWPDGAHLHLDVCMQNPGDRYVNVGDLDFIDPEPLLREACGDAEYQAMYSRWTG